MMMEMENGRERSMLKFHMHRNFECFRVEKRREEETDASEWSGVREGGREGPL